MKAPLWTEADAAAAAKEGWGLFNLETNPEIQEDDESGIFEADIDAFGFVILNQDRPHCAKAVRIVREREIETP